MNDIRRTILLVIFGFSLVMLWDQWQVHNGNKPTFLPSSKPVQTAANTPATPAGAGSADTLPGAAATPGNPMALPAQTAPAPAGEKVRVKTDVFAAVIDSQGGTLSELQLLQYLDEFHSGGFLDTFHDMTGQTPVAPSSRPVTLMADGSPATRYVAQTGLINVVDSGERFPNHLTPMMPVAGPREMAEGQNTLEVSFESQPVGGLKYVKTYVFTRGDYTIRVRHQVVNVSAQPLDAQLYLQFVRHGTVPSSTMFGTNTFTGPALYTDEKKFHKVAFTDITKNKAELPPAANNGWVAMVQHYFVSAWLLNVPGSDTLRREFRVADLGNNLFSVAMVVPLTKLAPGASQSVDSSLYAGPEEEKKLEALAPGLELVKDYGIFTIISKPLYWLLNQLHGILGNWGWSIVALVVLLKAKIAASLGLKLVLAAIVGLGLAWPVAVLAFVVVAGFVATILGALLGEGGLSGSDFDCSWDCGCKRERMKRLKHLIALRRAWLAAPNGPAPSIRRDPGRRFLTKKRRA